jgi:hypothetical protein
VERFTTRSFLKHTVYGTVIAIEADPQGEILAAVIINEPTGCKHQLQEYVLNLDVKEINKHKRDYQPLRAGLHRRRPLAERHRRRRRACAGAEAEYSRLHTLAGAAKKVLGEKQAALRGIVREATTGRLVLPLFSNI